MDPNKSFILNDYLIIQHDLKTLPPQHLPASKSGLRRALTLPSSGPCLRADPPPVRLCGTSSEVSAAPFDNVLSRKAPSAHTPSLSAPHAVALNFKTIL